MTRFLSLTGIRSCLCCCRWLPPVAAAREPAALFERQDRRRARRGADRAGSRCAPAIPPRPMPPAPANSSPRWKCWRPACYRHGFESPQSFMLPLMRLPVPPNPNPEPLTYEGFRDILIAFRDGMEKSAATLGIVPADADIGIEVDLARLGIDLNDDGAHRARTRAPPRSWRAMSRRPACAQAPRRSPRLIFRFDRADGYWLQGYANFLMAQADFWLAHDFQQRLRRLLPHAVPASRNCRCRTRWCRWTAA